MNSMISEIYIPDEIYEAVVNRLAEVIPLLGSSDDLRLRLGEVAKIWPAHVQAADGHDQILHAA